MWCRTTALANEAISCRLARSEIGRPIPDDRLLPPPLRGPVRLDRRPSAVSMGVDGVRHSQNPPLGLAHATAHDAIPRLLGEMILSESIYPIGRERHGG